jgi:hypothetical protein
MPHRERLRTARVTVFDEGLLNIAQNVVPQLRLRKISDAQMRIAAKLRRNLVNSLKEMQQNQEQYGFGPLQLKALGILIEKTRKAKSEADLLTVWRNTCFLKNAKK